MTMDKKEPSDAMTSDEMLLDIREKFNRCTKILQSISNDDRTDAAEAREQMASIYTWAVDMGVFCEAQLQSIDSPLKRNPKTGYLVKRLLSALEATLASSPMILQDVPLPDLHNKEIYSLFKSYARQKIDKLIPNASSMLRERMVESIATRRIRFLFIEQHHKTTSIQGEPATAFQKKEPKPCEGESAQAVPPADRQEVIRGGITPIKCYLDPSTQPSVIPSLTFTKLETENPQPAQGQHVDSVSSAEYSTAIDPTCASFTCPYCFLIYPLEEASRPSLLSRGHLIHDFEPLFCVFDSCSSPFMNTSAATYDDWFDHILHDHTKSQWLCWLFGMTPKPLLEECPFCGEFPAELEKAYPDQKSDQAYKALVEHIRDHLFMVAMDSISS
ncbi:uncharacterized protein TRIVIDRAFT_201921 [Trichoderma virens Gv29-8]|uniref:C2H2-type domain-containing protein n=1 Tax=Hypocrea virens (strain Gv29-8 / FGSC 10586) TaxID=413071 RepID=G9MVL2_HYPVG|nr:uncharacterized protein TRIVIDRAFT_201921 [Trichoderma virens Gv29-8]EHK21510.1 hypothetical protein TRIVIDRAFT_201921 [Trichoderma virens Gv29-8]UKZ53450.1 hypothetical protein TrVGV298_007242 [Trichoderma virens]